MMGTTLESDGECVRNSVELLRSKSVIVSGGAGFIGSWLCDFLIQGGARVCCLDNFSTGLKSNVAHLLRNSTFTLMQFDVTRPQLNTPSCDLILHFAGRAAPDEYQLHPVETLEVNSFGTQTLLDLARNNEAQLIYASTSEIYGDAEIVPTPEDYWGHVNPVGTRSCYDEAKRYGEALCMAYHRAYGVDTRIVRIFNTFGPRLRADGLYGRALSRFILQALANDDITVYGKGDQTRSFCYVTDTIEAILRMTARPSMKGQVVNIGNPQEITILELAEKIKTLTNSKSKITFHPIPPDDPKRRCPDITKAKTMLQWTPRISLEEGLKRTIQWFESKQK